MTDHGRCNVQPLEVNTVIEMCEAPILVVDDDDDVREIVALALEDEGFRVTRAENGRVALMHIDRQRPALVLLDLMMPVMSGWALWDHLQSVPSLRTLPVVILTASGLSQGSFGPTTVLSKPVSHARLIEVARTFACA
jgi:two-component system, response regulator, stage 0 sporulation protein F